MIGYKFGENLGGGRTSVHPQMASQRRETSPSNNGTNELIANLDHELLDVRVRALKCLLRKLECGIVSSDKLKDRVDLLDRCRRWLSQTEEGQKSGENSANKNSYLESSELEGIELVVQLLSILSKHKEFRDLMRKENVDSLLVKLQPYLAGDHKYQLDALLNSLVVGQYELSYEGGPSEWYDNNTGRGSSKTSEMFSSRPNPYTYKPYGELNLSQDLRSTPPAEESDSSRNTPDKVLAKKSGIPLGNEDGWVQSIQFFIPYVNLSATDRRVMNSTVDSLSATSDSLVIMTVSFIRDTLTMDFPGELFLQDASLLLALAQVTISRWSDRLIPYAATQTLLKISSILRLRYTQLNHCEQYVVPTPSYDPVQKSGNSYNYDYDRMSYSSRVTPKAGTTSTTTDAVVENFIQLFKSFSRALTYTSYDLHIWPVFESFAFTLYKCVSTFPLDSKTLTLSLQGVLMELAHIWERRSDYHTVVGLCLVSTSILNAMKVHNETFIVSKDVRNMLRSLSCSAVIRSGWPELFQYFLQFSSMFDPSAGVASDQKEPTPEGDSSDNHPKQKILKLLYAIQNASSHDEVFDSVDSLRDVLLPITLNIRLGEDSLLYVLKDVPWRDTFYRFLCIEPTTEGDEDLLGRVLDVFTYILQNSINASIFKWITPLCCEKACTTLKLLQGYALKKEVKYGGTALPELLRSLLEFYSSVLKHGSVLLSAETKWELFNIYSAILHSLEQSSYSNFALLSAITKELANISDDKFIQGKMRENPVLAVAMLHRITDAIIVLEASGSLFEGYKNSCGLYYLSICLVHMIIPLMKDDNHKNFKSEWIERCSRAFQILALSPDPRTKSQAFQLCEVLTSCSPTMFVFAEASFRDSVVSLLESAYSTMVDLKQPSAIKFRAGNVVLNILKQEDEKPRYNLARKLQQGFSVLVDMSRLSSRVLWNSKVSAVVQDGKSGNKQNESYNVTSDGIPFITPRVLTILCKVLMTFVQSLVEGNEGGSLLQEVTSSGICQMLFRIVLRQTLTTEGDCRVWLDCCCAISIVVETLIILAHLDRTVSIILIGEKRCLSTMLSLLEVEVPSQKGIVREKAEEAASALSGNILNLATVLCCDAGNNFEDLERVAWSHQQALFTKLCDWLKVTTPLASRRSALSFSQGFLSVLSHRTSALNKNDSNSESSSHPFLCRTWKDSVTYGQALCERLVNILKHSVDLGERMSAMKCLAALFSLSGSSVRYAVEDNDIIHFCVQKLQGFGNKYFETKGSSISGKKSTNVIHTETLSFMELLSCIFYVSAEAKPLGLKYNFPDVVHKIFSWWTAYPDLNLLHTYVEALLNFTEDFPQGALAMTLTSNVAGVAPRRVPTQQSIFMEILGILEHELSHVESSPNLKTIEIILELLKNICFAQECRNILLKSPVMLFLRKLHSQETKKWGSKQNAVKATYLEFLVHASVHPDVQTFIAKIPEGLEILVQIVETDHSPVSTSALKVLRNLCFQQANRGRLITENMFMPSLSHKLSQSTDLEEVEHATVSLWALIANFEKGRLHAKKSYCSESLSKALERIRKLEQTTGAESDSEKIAHVIELLEKVQQLLGSSNPGKQFTMSRTSSVSQSQQLL